MNKNHYDNVNMLTDKMNDLKLYNNTMTDTMTDLTSDTMTDLTSDTISVITSDTISVITTDITDLMNDLIDEFVIVNTYDAYDEYELLVKAANCDYNNYNIQETIYRYKRYIKHIKLPFEIYNNINQYLKVPRYELMKVIDNSILKFL